VAQPVDWPDVKSRRRAQVISIAVAITIFVFGGPRQASQATPKVDIGTACVMDRGGPQVCR
jgi:hypothetical protein